MDTFEIDEAPTCPDCPEDASYSVTEHESTKTLMSVQPPVWDSEGNYHPTLDPNTVTTRYQCSNGHEWTETRHQNGYEEKIEAREEARENGWL